jgi:hypothetical protein
MSESEEREELTMPNETCQPGGHPWPEVFAALMAMDPVGGDHCLAFRGVELTRAPKKMKRLIAVFILEPKVKIRR